jgi:HK97 family phage major capsid protein
MIVAMIATHLRLPTATTTACVTGVRRAVNGETIMNIEMLQQRAASLQKQGELILAAADRDVRVPTESEKAELAAFRKEIDGIAAKIEQAQGDDMLRQKVEQLTGGNRGRGIRGAGAGALFASNEEVRRFIASGGHRRTGEWHTPPVEVSYEALRATTLTEDPASGGKLIVPDYRPGVVPAATPPIVVMDLLMPGTTGSNSVVYMVETQFTDAAAPVAEGAAKPESALVFTQIQEPVLKCAHWLPVTEELLEDAPAIQSYIDGRLTLGVQLAEEDQLLNGNGTPPNYKGLLLRATAPTITQGASESVADAILRQIAAISTTAMVRPSGIVMNPVDWTPTMTIKSTTGEYIGPSPFETPQVPTLWGLPVAITPSIAAKTVLVGAFATQAQFFRRGGLRVEASNSHQDFFVRDLVAIRAEERGALCVYRPGAFGKVTLL